MDHEGYAAVYVYHPEVMGILGSEEPSAQTIEFFAKSVGMRQPSRMRRLIMDGHTPATLMANPSTKALQYYLTRVDAEAFHERFFTSRTMALALGRSWQSLNADHRRKSIEPFSPNDEDYRILYLHRTVLSHPKNKIGRCHVLRP